MHEPAASIRVLEVDDTPRLTADEGEAGTPELRLTTAPDGETGIERLETKQVDAVVVTDSLPDMAWPDFVDKARERTADTPLVLVTESEDTATEALSGDVTEVFNPGRGDRADVLANRVRLLVDRHEATATANRTARWLRELTDQSSELLWMFSGDWSELLFVNSTYEQLYGRSVEHLRADPASFMTAIHPDDQQQVAAVMQQISTGESVTAEFRITHSEEGQRWVHAAATPVLEDGDVTRIIGVSRDITETKRSVETSTEEAAPSPLDPDQLFDALPYLVYALNGDGELVRWNDRLATRTGYSDDAIAGMDFSEFFEPSDRETVRDGIETALADGDVSFEAALQTAAESTVPYEFSACRFKRRDGSVGGVVGIGRDIADRRSRQRALDGQNQRLDEFASGASHDLRKPLDVARGHLELARLDHDSEHLDTVKDAHDRIGRLIDDLLTLAQQSEAALDAEAVPLQTVVEGCWQTVDTGEATLTLQTEAVVRADPGQLRQLFANLIRNAVTHGPGMPAVEAERSDNGGEGGSTQSLSQARTGAGSRDCPELNITVGDSERGFYVADDGVGVPAADRDQVFESGYSPAGGTGFGLRIVREIADSHGWSVTVTESGAGGTRFEVTGVAFEST